MHVNFTPKEWVLLHPSKKNLCNDVKLGTFRNLTAIGEMLKFISYLNIREQMFSGYWCSPMISTKKKEECGEYIMHGAKFH